jgi:hypothetical protein
MTHKRVFYSLHRWGGLGSHYSARLAAVPVYSKDRPTLSVTCPSTVRFIFDSGTNLVSSSQHAAVHAAAMQSSRTKAEAFTKSARS